MTFQGLTERCVLTFLPLSHALKKVLGGSCPALEDAAVDRWVISPATKQHVLPARFLPHHLDRIRGAAFAPLRDVVKGLIGGFDVMQPATVGYRLKDVALVNGILYGSRAMKSLRGRSRWFPTYLRMTPSITGVIFESWVGNRWFGNWLSDDCLTYHLAEVHGVPRQTRQTAYLHEPQYLTKLDMKPALVENVHFNELILFDDGGQNAGKSQRAGEARRRLVASMPYAFPHPGVFILRGASGEKRVLSNERDLAERFVSHYGFRIIDPSVSSVDEIVAACAGARVVAGVEGSHLVHGAAVMGPNATLFVIQPADRVVSALKILTDRQQQSYAFVIGEGHSRSFHVAWDDIDRTMELVHK